MSQDNHPELILASASPRRRALLQQIGVTFQVRTVDVDETPKLSENPEAYVLRLARDKAEAVANTLASPQWVLGSDTAVVVDDEILGKPVDLADLQRMLARLSGRSHRVLTGVVLSGIRAESCLSDSTVWFRNIDAREIEAYWRSGEPCDKAGGYAIQGLGAVFVRQLSGSFSGVMGLPLFETAQMLSRVGIRLWNDPTDSAY